MTILSEYLLLFDKNIDIAMNLWTLIMNFCKKKKEWIDNQV